MTAPELIEISPSIPGLRSRLHSNAAASIVSTLLDDPPPAKALVCEASVHLPRSGSVWVASFTGSHGGQVWKSTGLTDHEKALVLARRWEAEARAQRSKLGRPDRRPTLRVRRNSPGAVRSGLLTQKEVALLLNMSERGVREVERRAFQKLRQHPLLRQARQQYQAGELDEQQLELTPEEIEALFSLARTSEERGLLQRVLRLFQHGPAALAVASGGEKRLASTNEPE